MDKWPAHPVIYEINTWIWLNELSRRYQTPISLANVPDSGMGHDDRLVPRCSLADGSLGAEPAWRVQPRCERQSSPGTRTRCLILLRRMWWALPTLYVATRWTGIWVDPRDWLARGRRWRAWGAVDSGFCAQPCGGGSSLGFDHPEYFIQGDEVDLQAPRSVFP